MTPVCPGGVEGPQCYDEPPMRASLLSLLSLLVLCAGCNANPPATIGGKTGAFSTWTEQDCSCLFSPKGTQGITHDVVTVNCQAGTKPPPESDLMVDVNVNAWGERLMGQSVAGGALPRSRNPFVIDVFTDAASGRVENVPNTKRYRLPVQVFKLHIPAQRACDRFTASHDECVDVPDSTLTNLFTWCDVGTAQ